MQDDARPPVATLNTGEATKQRARLPHVRTARHAVALASWHFVFGDLRVNSYC